MHKAMKLLIPGLAVILAPLATAADYTIAERLGRTWSRELVTFDATAEQAAHARQSHLLTNAAGKGVNYQLLPDNRLAVVVDLLPNQVEVLTFTDEVVSTATDLTVEEAGGAIRLGNSQAGIAIRTRLAPGEGPIAGIRLGSEERFGAIGGSRLDLPAETLATYRATIDYAGQVVAQVTCTFGDPAAPTWKLVFRLQAGEPAVTVEEDFRGAEAADFELELGTGWEPGKLLYRYGKGAEGKPVGKVDIAELSAIEGSTKFVLEPWIHWWERVQQGNWFGLFAAEDGPLLMIGAYRPSVWVDPAQPREDRSLARLPLVAGEGGTLTLRFKGRHAQRAWMIAAYDGAQALPGATDYDPRFGPKTPLPQTALIKHGHFPLEKLNGQVLAWERQPRPHPRLYVDQPTLASVREQYEPDERAIQNILRGDIRQFEYDDIFYHYLGSGDDALGKKLSEAARSKVEAACRMIYEQDSLVYYGFAPHHQSSIITATTIADLIWDSAHLSDADRDLMAGQLAFIAYAVSGADYWSQERGFAANPNMTTTVASFQTVLGAFLRDHPLADSWLGMGLKELERQVEEWSDAEGGWLECPHYAMVSYDYYLGYFLMARLAGYSESLYSDKMKKIITWFAKIATPPDGRIKGWRHNPPLGNTWKIEPCGEYSTVAALWRERDPEFAAQMAWMHRQQGSQLVPGVGGFFATLAGYRRIYRTVQVEPKAPAWGSDLFPETTVVLRSHFPSDRETMVTMIAGSNHAHYDHDSGSLTLWGKGRIVCDDFGYEGAMPGWQHSMLIAPGAPQGGILKVDRFHTAAGGDYASGVKQEWRRHLVLARDADPSGPNFLVIRDVLAKPGPGEWRLWFTADRVENSADGASVTGSEDVDTQVALLARPAGAVLSNDTYASNTWGLNGEARYGRYQWPQTSLTVKWEQGDELLAVVYPRLRGEGPATITALPDNLGVKVVSVAGTDYVFLCREPSKASIDGIEFEGTVGIVQRRAGKPTAVSIPAGTGRITADGIEAAAP